MTAFLHKRRCRVFYGCLLTLEVVLKPIRAWWQSRNSPCLRLAASVLGSVLVLTSVQKAAGNDVRLVRLENWSTAFADKRITYRLKVVSKGEIPEGTLQWSYSANQRTLARGETNVKRTDDLSGTAEIVLQLPRLRDGVVFKTLIAADFIPQGENRPAASTTQPLWLFPENPIKGRTEWTASLNIALFDPVGKTTDAFNKIQLPYRRIRNAASLHVPEQKGILIVGEGAELQPSVIEDLSAAAQSGQHVIILAPERCTIPIAGSADGNTAAAELRYARSHIISELDKRLDAEAWLGAENRVPARGLMMKSRRDQIEVTVSDRDDSWPWLEIHDSTRRSRIVYCGFQIIRHFDNGPTPRFFLIRLLESLSPNNE